MPISVARRLFVLITLFSTGTLSLTAQALSESEQSKVLTSAKSQYYNLRSAGLKDLRCDVSIDWPALFAGLGAPALPPDDPNMVYLQSSHLTLHTNFIDPAEVIWALPVTPPPASTQKGFEQLQGGMKQMLSGFMQSWAPTLNGKLITLSPRQLTHTSTGYLLDDATPPAKDLLTLDNKLMITHMATISGEIAGEFDPTFTASPDGLLMTALDGDYKQPVDGPSTHVTMTTTYQTVDSFHIPEHLKLGVKNIATFEMQLTHCVVNHSDKAEPAAKP